MKFGKRKKPKPINPRKDDRNWHENLCLIYRLGPEMFETFCPHQKELEEQPEKDDWCHVCPYSFLMDYDSETKLVQIWGDANVLNPAHDFTNYI